LQDGRFQFVRAKNAPVADDEILADLRRVAEEQGTDKITEKLYGEHGRYDASNIGRRFGTWNKALLQAGLTLSNSYNFTDEALFENILVLWQHYGRQPRRSELTSPPSAISQSPYKRRFQSWSGALQSFVEYANSAESELPEQKAKIPAPTKKTGRDPSLRLRFKVLSRDNFSCQQCGASPAKDPTVELHVDHRVPWSNGGETTMENLQTLCRSCNLGKSNL
jgi:HNH endonuclease/Homing endonuclease associated repeat